MRGLCFYIMLAGFAWYWAFLHPSPRRLATISYPEDGGLVFVNN